MLFELNSEKSAAEVFMNNIKLTAIETYVADARTRCLNLQYLPTDR